MGVMLATVMYRAGDVRVETVPDAQLVGLDEAPDGFRAMNDRDSIKVMVELP